MAKLHNKTVQAALSRIQTTGRATLADKPLVDQGLIEVNPEDVVNDEAAARLTQKGFDGMPKKAEAGAATSTPSKFAIIDNATPPESKRGAGRVAGPSKYPFDDLQTGKSFFVSNTEVEGGNALKTLGSAVANATNKHRVDTGTTKSVTRAQREGKKAKLGPDGKKIMETVSVPVYSYPVKFVIRGVKQGQKCGAWEAPADGALITRTV